MPLYQAVESGTMDIEQLLQTLDEMLFANLYVTMGGLSRNLLLHPRCWQLRSLESARLKPSAAFSVPQSVPTARRVGEFLVPPRTNFIVDTRAVNIHNLFWGDDGETYRPATFLGQKASEMWYQYWRFGFGPRRSWESMLSTSSSMLPRRI